MELVIFEKKTFEGIVAKWESLLQQIEVLNHRHGEKKMNKWLDNHDVCRVLKISPRTLQTLRDNGTLAYTKIGNRTYYRPEDVERIVSNVEDRRKEAYWNGRTI